MYYSKSFYFSYIVIYHLHFNYFRCVCVCVRERERERERYLSLTHNMPSLLMMPKHSPVRYTILTLEQPVPENKKVQRKAF